MSEINMWESKLRQLFTISAVLCLVAGCASQRGGSPVVSPSSTAPVCPLCIDPTSPQILAAYTAALADAKYPAPEKISRQLTPLLPTTDGLIWNDRGEILMVTWTKTQYFSDPEKHRRGEPFSLAVDTWLTAAPFVRDFCQAQRLDDPMLILRLEQLIGLPPGRGKDAFLEVWVDPADVFRPCPDPEISDHECQVEIPMIDRAAPPDTPTGPWDCSAKRQVSDRFVTVNPDHLQWMCYNWTLSYGSDDPFDNYPWTALGYTYDWGSPEDPRGVSEYVSPKGSEVVFHSLTPTELYCSSLGEEE